MAAHDRSIDIQTLHHFFAVCRRYPLDLWLACLTPISGLGLGVAVPYYVGKILGSLAVPGRNETSLLIGLAAACLLTVVANGVAYKYYLSLQPKVMADLQREAFDALMQRGSGYHNNRVSGKLVSDIIDYPSAFSQLSTTFFVDIAPFAFVIVFGITLVAVKSPFLGLILFLMAVLAIGSSVLFRRRMTPFRIRRQALNKDVTSHVADAIVNNQTVKTFGSEVAELKAHGALSRQLMAARLHDWGQVAKDGNYRIGALMLFEIVFVAVVIHEVHRNPALLATGIFAFSYTVTLSNRLFQIATMMRSVEEALLLAMPTTEMLAEQPEILDKPGALKLHASQGKIVFRALSFSYPDNRRGTTVFKDLNLEISAGQKIGLVGPSGGGKSTLTKLLLRFEDLTGGQILIDGQNISDVTQQSLRQAISYVPQEPLLFHRTVRDNIAYGKPDATKAEIVDAARKAYADDFITALPDSYDTIVGERGVKLSGGQRQRVAIARAILKDAPILVLDEATSALDSESEKVIQSALTELMKHKTTIVIAHRLSTIQRLDSIVVLDDGKIVESGTHTSLITRKDGLYARLWAHQSGGFIDD